MCSRVEGTALLEELVMIDQSPIGRTPRSNPVTYIQAFDLIRTHYADTSEPASGATAQDIFPST
jgi:excinuclease ABC subunit A